MSDNRAPILQALDHAREISDHLLGHQETWARQAYYANYELVRVLVALAKRDTAGVVYPVPNANDPA